MGRSRKVLAFSLIELLITIAIIAILAALILPALARAKAAAHSALCKSNEKQMGVALSMYVGDAHVFPLAAYHTTATRKMATFWFDALSPYLAGAAWTQGVYRCPTFKSSWHGFAGVGTADGGIWEAIGAYAYNSDGYLKTGIGRRGFGYVSTPQFPSKPRSESEIRAPDNMFALGDSQILETRGTGRNAISGGSFIYWMNPRRDSPANGLFLNTNLFQHSSGYNMLAADGHVEHQKANKLFSKDPAAMSRWNFDNLP